MVWGPMFQVVGFRLNSIGLEVEVSGELQVIGTRVMMAARAAVESQQSQPKYCSIVAAIILILQGQPRCRRWWYGGLVVS